MFAGLDVGTTGCKIVVYNELGEQLYLSYKDYPMTHVDGNDEINVKDLFSSVKYVIKDTLVKYPNIKGMGVDSFGESFVLFDENDQPLTNIIAASDGRGKEELEDLINYFGSNRISQITGAKPAVTYSFAKLAWIKNNKPDLFKKVKRALLIEDAVIYMLTGNPYIDYSLAARTMMFDINNLCWAKEIFDYVQIDSNIMSEPKPLGFRCGCIKETLQKELGIQTQLEIIAAGHDQVSVAIGSGIIDVNTATDGAGTSECISSIFDKNADFEKLMSNNYAIVPFIDDKYITYAYSFTSGSLINWYLEKIIKEKDNPNIFALLEEGFKDHPSQILLLPHFSGAATPYMDPESQSLIYGLNLSHTRDDLYQAILEGVAYEMMINIERLKQGLVSPLYLVASGGGAKSTKWLQIKANILNIPIKVLSGKECGCRGGAMLSAVSTGYFSSLAKAIDTFVSIQKEIIPNEAMHKEYTKWYDKYCLLYRLSKELYNE